MVISIEQKVVQKGQGRPKDIYGAGTACAAGLPLAIAAA